MFHTDILFTGFYGFKNSGDDAFVEACSWGAHNFWNKNNIRFISNKQNLPDTIISVKGYPFSIPKTYGFQSQFLLQNTDYLISGGGSTIHSKMRADNIKNQAIRLKKKDNNIKVGGIGVSVGPFKSVEDEQAIKNYLKSIDFLAVRDQTSFDYLSSLDLPYEPVNAFDLAALLPEIYNFKKKNNEYKSRKTI